MASVVTVVVGVLAVVVTRRQHGDRRGRVGGGIVRPDLRAGICFHVRMRMRRSSNQSLSQ